MGGQDLAARGTEVRSRRASLKEAIVNGGVDVAELLEGDGDPTIEAIALGMQTHHLVESVPGIGHETAVELLGALYARTLGSLPMGNRRELAAQVRKRAR